MNSMSNAASCVEAGSVALLHMMCVCVSVCVCAAMWQGRMRQAALTPLVSHESHIRSGLLLPAAAAPGHYGNHMLDLCRRLMFHGFIKGDESGSQWPD